MRNISSVSVFKIRKSSFIDRIVFTVGILAFIRTNNGLRVIAGAVVLASFISMAMKRDKYFVRISTNSAETNALISKNRNYVQSIPEYTLYNSVMPFLVLNSKK